MADTNINTKGYAWVDNKFLDDDRLHYYDTLVYIQLCRHANVETDETFISQGKIAEKIGISRPTVNKSIKHLYELGYIEMEARARKNGGRTSSLYRILDAYEVATSSQSKDDLQLNENQSKHDLQGEGSQSKDDLHGTPAKVNLVNNINNTNINKSLNINNSTNNLPSNIASQSSLFSVPNKPSTVEELVLTKRRGKSRSLELINLYKEGRVGLDKFDTLDLCYYYTTVHKEIVGKVVSVVTADKKSENDLSIFFDSFDLDANKFVEMLPAILNNFIEQDSLKAKDKRQNKLNIGNLAQNWFMEPIMNKVKPKVNEKYLDKDEPELTGNPHRQVDEVF